MRTLTLAVCLASCLAVSLCHAQGPAEAPPRLLAVARVMDFGMDLQVLGELWRLQLTEQQLQALNGVYAQNPVPGFNLEAAEQVVAKLEGFRRRLIAGENAEKVMSGMQGLETQIQGVFGSLFDRRTPQEVPDYKLTPAEQLIWEILTPEQRGKLLGGRQGQSTARQVLSVVGTARLADAATWTTSRDRIAACLSAPVGADGTPERENRRQMFLDFLDRVRKLTEPEYVRQQEQLAAELTPLLPADVDLAAAIHEYAPGYVHNALAVTLLHPRAQSLVAEMVAARAAKPGN